MNGNESNICGIQIKVLRKKNNLTQKQLAELLHNEQKCRSKI